MRVLFLVSMAALALGCGAPMTDPSDAGLSSDNREGGEVDAGPSDAGGATDSGVPDAGPLLPGVPVLTSVSLVTHGTMAITWQAPASGCTTVALLMKTGAGAYSIVRTVTGVATSTQYSPGHANGTYCYEVTCTLQGVESAASNERCATQ